MTTINLSEYIIDEIRDTLLQKLISGEIRVPVDEEQSRREP